jgi:AraC-like DNA-binding protein
MPFYQYYRHKTMQQALEWLLTDNLSVIEISQRLGYRQPIKFIQQFKKHFGDTPFQYKIKKSRYYF